MPTQRRRHDHKDRVFFCAVLTLWALPCSPSLAFVFYAIIADAVFCALVLLSLSCPCRQSLGLVHVKFQVI